MRSAHAFAQGLFAAGKGDRLSAERKEGGEGGALSDEADPAEAGLTKSKEAKAVATACASLVHLQVQVVLDSMMSSRLELAQIYRLHRETWSKRMKMRP